MSANTTQEAHMTSPTGGRPTLFTPELAATICDRLAAGQSLRQICRGEDMPAESTVRRWALDDVQGFAAQFKRACELRAHALADEIIEISDDGRNDWMERQRGDGSTERVVDHEHIQRSKLRTDNRRWLLSKVLPTVYGDKLAMDVTQRGMTLEEAVRASMKNREARLAAELAAQQTPALPAPTAPNGSLADELREALRRPPEARNRGGDGGSDR